METDATMETAAPKYTCPRCHYKTDDRRNYAKHLSRKTPCDSLYSFVPVPDLLSTLNQEKEFKSDKCNKSYSQPHDYLKLTGSSEK